MVLGLGFVVLFFFFSVSLSKHYAYICGIYNPWWNEAFNRLLCIYAVSCVCLPNWYFCFWSRSLPLIQKPYSLCFSRLTWWLSLTSLLCWLLTFRMHLFLMVLICWAYLFSMWFAFFWYWSVKSVQMMIWTDDPTPMHSEDFTKELFKSDARFHCWIPSNLSPISYEIIEFRAKQRIERLGEELVCFATSVLLWLQYGRSMNFCCDLCVIV